MRDTERLHHHYAIPVPDSLTPLHIYSNFSSAVCFLQGAPEVTHAVSAQTHSMLHYRYIFYPRFFCLLECRELVWLSRETGTRLAGVYTKANTLVRCGVNCMGFRVVLHDVGGQKHHSQPVPTHLTARRTPRKKF